MFDDYVVGPQCEDFYDDRWSDTDWGWLAFFGDEEPEFESVYDET